MLHDLKFRPLVL